MKLTEEILDQLIMEQLSRLDEELTVDIGVTSKEIFNADPSADNAESKLLTLIKLAMDNLKTGKDLELKDLEDVAEINEDTNKFELDDFAQYVKKFADPKSDLDTDKRNTEYFRKLKVALQRTINILTQAINAGQDDDIIKNMLAKAKTIMAGDYSKDTPEPGFDPFEKDPDTSQVSSLPQIPLEISMGGKLAPATANAFSEAFAGATTVEARVNRMAELASNITVGKNPTGTIGENVSGLVILDALARMTRSIEAGSASGWLLEGFLGALFGGTDVGAAMGAADFSLKGIFSSKGVKGGSAKFYASTATSFGGQSYTDFNKLAAGESIRYVMAEKATDTGKRATGIAAKTFVAIQVYIVDVKRKQVTPKWTANGNTIDAVDTLPENWQNATRMRAALIAVAKDFEFVIYGPKGTSTIPFAIPKTSTSAAILKGSGNTLQVFADKGKKIRFKFARDQPKKWPKPFNIPIPQVTDYQTNIKTATKLVSAKVNDMFETASRLRSRMDSYVMGGDITDGLASVKEYTTLKNKINEAYGDLEKETGVKPQINENNLENILDKLIQEVILTK